MTVTNPCNTGLREFFHHHHQPSRLRCWMKASSMLSYSVRTCDTAAQFFRLPKCFVMASAQRFFCLPRLRFPWGFHIVRSCAQLLVIRDTCSAHFHFCLMMIVISSGSLDLSLTVLLVTQSCHFMSSIFLSIAVCEASSFLSILLLIVYVSQP